MKPSWDDAPEWANWLAMDGDGWWCWFEKKPELCFDCWVCDDGECEEAPGQIGYGDSLEKRP